MSHRAIYGIVAAVFGVLLVVMLVTYNYNKSSEEALAKAQQLTATLGQAGLPTPRDPAQVAKVFGTDGGSVCASVQDGVALGIAKFNLSVGGEFYRRAVIADRRVAAGILRGRQDLLPRQDSYAAEVPRPAIRHGRACLMAPAPRRRTSRTSAPGPGRRTGALRAKVSHLMPQAKSDLREMVSIKSVHDATQFPPAECQRMVDFLVDAFTEVGLQDVQGYETADGSQAVCGHKPGPPGSPTVLLYFHHDVQPPLDESAWETPIWDLTEKNDRWYGRGAADCKGNIAVHLTALRALGDDLPVTVKIVGEGSEEQGTGGLEAFVPEHPELLAADAILVCDAGQLRGRCTEPHQQPPRPGQRLGDRSNAVQSDALGDVRRCRPGRLGCADRHAGHPS